MQLNSVEIVSNGFNCILDRHDIRYTKQNNEKATITKLIYNIELISLHEKYNISPRLVDLIFKISIRVAFVFKPLIFISKKIRMLFSGVKNK